MSRKKSSSIPVARARPKKLKDLPRESTMNTIFRDRTYCKQNDFHNRESYMGVIGQGQTPVQRGDRNEFKSLDLKRIHARRQSRSRYFKQAEVSSRKAPVASDNRLGKASYPSVMPNPQSSMWGPDSAIGGGDKWCSPWGPQIAQFANTPQSLPSHPVYYNSPSSIQVGASGLFDGSAAMSEPKAWFGEKPDAFPGFCSYQHHEPSGSSTYLGYFSEMGYPR